MCSATCSEVFFPRALKFNRGPFLVDLFHFNTAKITMHIFTIISCTLLCKLFMFKNAITDTKFKKVCPKQHPQAYNKDTKQSSNIYAE